MRPGNGRILVNQREFEEYFPMETTRNLVKKPLLLVNVGPDFDIVVNVRGGGIEGQAGAVKHALSRALVLFNPELRAYPEKGRLSHPGLPHQRAEEIRSPGRPPRLPVFQALSHLGQSPVSYYGSEQLAMSRLISLGAGLREPALTRFSPGLFP